MSASRNFAGRVHPNAVIARQEKERQERSRLRRLSEVRPTSSSGGNTAGGRSRQRPASASRIQRPARPTSGQLSGQRQNDEQFESLKSRVSSPTSSPTRPWNEGRRSSSETAMRLRTSFMVCPQRRAEDATNQFQVSTAEQAEALKEELQSWYFGVGATFQIEAVSTSPGSNSSDQAAGSPVDPWSDGHGRPTVDVLEEAAAAVRTKVTATSSIPGYSSNNFCAVDRTAFAPGRGASGGCRGVAAATANRQLLVR
jgi:hypothetical protein